MPFSARLAVTFLLSLVVVSTHAAAPKVDFNRDVRPILSDNCFNCHGQDAGARKAKLRLDDRAAALAGGKSGSPAIVPGNPERSELILRITEPHDSEDRMPTIDSKKSPLTPAQVATLRQWIGEGAEYQGHWAFIAPARPAVSGSVVQGAAPNSKTSANPIDAFIAARRNAAGLRASPEATPETLCRRLWLDLTGLPPSPAELDEFLAAFAKNGDAAYRALVEKLLASPRYGEKWARHWLDAARYADSDGYEKDMPRQQWAWRDWVINSLNADQPYDQFIVEQIAGDLLAVHEPDPLRAQNLRVATGYLRNSMVSEEGAIINEQYRAEGMFDRMDAIGKGVLGVTLQCAQCHTHKFDPITHEDYFSLFAALNNTYEATSRVYAPEKLSVAERIRREIAAADDTVKSAQPDWSQRLTSWIEAERATAAATSWETVTPLEPIWGGGLSHPDVLPDGSVLTLGFRPTDGELSFTATPKVAGITALRIEALNHGDLIFGGPGRSVDGLFAVSELVVESLPAGEKKGTKIELEADSATADFDSAERLIGNPFRKNEDDKRTVGPSSFLIDGKVETAWSPDRGPGRRNAPTEVVVHFKSPVTLAESHTLRVMLRFKHGGKDIHGRECHHLGRFRVAVTTAACAVASKIPTAARLALATPETARSPAQQAALFAAWRSTVPEFSETTVAIEKLWAQFPAEDTTILHLAERSAEDARGTFILDRGAWDKPKTRVTPRTPAFLHARRAEGAGEPDRLAFARWLVDRRSPTTARVAVNRTWQALFGAGLVDTPEDFGVRAAAPSQPEVLDWLAVDFMDRGWSQKQLVRTIVTSATYRQSSRTTPEHLERDPRNRLLARGPRFRADAEVVRDIALRTSGLLTEKIGGPSVYPPVPESLFASSFIPVDFWKTATGAERYRRSLYVFRRRSMPDPMLSSFDAPNGDVACAARPRSNTPLAALASLNETVFVEAAQALALRVLREGGPTDAARAAYAFRLCTSRVAEPTEIADLVDVLATPRARVADGWISAREVAFGDAAKLPELPPGITPADAAAWTVAARVLLNLDETLSKN